jgi:hypothetical protein
LADSIKCFYRFWAVKKILKIQDGAHIQYGVLASLSRSSGIRQKIQNAKIFAFS